MHDAKLKVMLTVCFDTCQIYIRALKEDQINNFVLILGGRTSKLKLNDLVSSYEEG